MKSRSREGDRVTGRTQVRPGWRELVMVAAARFHYRKELLTTETRRYGVFLFISLCLCFSVLRRLYFRQ